MRTWNGAYFPLYFHVRINADGDTIELLYHNAVRGNPVSGDLVSQINISTIPEQLRFETDPVEAARYFAMRAWGALRTSAEHSKAQAAEIAAKAKEDREARLAEEMASLRGQNAVARLFPGVTAYRDTENDGT